MPIVSDSTEIIVPDTKTVSSAQIFVDVEDMHVGRPAMRGGSPPLTIVATEYTGQQDGSRLYAAISEDIHTDDLFGLCGTCPEVYAAVQAIYAAVPAVRRLKAANAARLEAAKAAHAPIEQQAAATIAQAEANFTAADAAYTQAYQARQGNDDPAWQDAIQARKNAEMAVLTAQAEAAALLATAPTAARLAIAQAAVDDPANPPLTV